MDIKKEDIQSVGLPEEHSRDRDSYCRLHVITRYYSYHISYYIMVSYFK